MDFSRAEKLTTNICASHMAAGGSSVAGEGEDGFVEEILRPNPREFSMFPVNPKYMHLYELGEKQEQSMWNTREINMAEDRRDFLAMDADEQNFIKQILAFFANFDGVVIKNLGENFASEVTISEARYFYDLQTGMERIHAKTYGLLIENIITNMREKELMHNAIVELPAIKKMGDWAMQWMDGGKRTFAERLVAFATVEGVLFSGAFCAVYWLREKGKCPGLCQANDLIAKDEGLHTVFAIELFKLLERKPSEETVHAIVGGAIECEKEFIGSMLPYNLISMNKDLMNQYMEFVADWLLTSLGYRKKYGVTCPFSWMERINYRTQANFFEKRETGYSTDSSSGAIELTEEY